MPRGRFVNRPYEALYIKDYLLASSFATATATCHVKQPAVVSNHGVVICADETHHLCAAVNFVDIRPITAPSSGVSIFRRRFCNRP